MRTTVEISDDLFRQAKARAALEGLRLRDLIEKGLRLVLTMPLTAETSRRAQFPLHRSRQPGALSAGEVRRAEEQAQHDEDATRAHAL